MAWHLKLVLQTTLRNPTNPLLRNGATQLVDTRSVDMQEKHHARLVNLVWNLKTCHQLLAVSFRSVGLGSEACLHRLLPDRHNNCIVEPEIVERDALDQAGGTATMYAAWEDAPRPHGMSYPKLRFIAPLNDDAVFLPAQSRACRPDRTCARGHGWRQRHHTCNQNRPVCVRPICRAGRGAVTQAADIEHCRRTY